MFEEKDKLMIWLEINITLALFGKYFKPGRKVDFENKKLSAFQ